MKKLSAVFLAVLLLVSSFSASADFEDADPVVGAWVVFTMSEYSHTFEILIFYPDGVLWDHLIDVENDKVVTKANLAQHWTRAKGGDLIVDSRDTKKKGHFYGNDILAIEDGETVITYLRVKDAWDVLFRTAADNSSFSLELEPGKGYSIGKDIPEGFYMIEYAFDSGRFYIFSSKKNFKKDIAESTELVGSVYGIPYVFSKYFSEGQIIKVNQSGCTLYRIE